MVGDALRRRSGMILSAAAAMALALTLTACGSNPNPSDSGNAALGNAPSSSASASPGTSPSNAGTNSGGTGGGSGGGSGPSYPKDAKSYGLEILKAVAAKDYTRLGNLADANTVNYSKQYASKNASWTNTNCDLSGPQTNCYYYNQTGDVAQVGMTTAKLGNPGAGTLVYLDQSTFPNDPSSYVSAFSNIWTNGGSYARMVSLSSASITDHFVNGVGKLNAGGGGIQASAPHSCTTNASKTCIDVSAVGGSLNLPIQHFIVDTTKVSAGKPNGIIGYEPQTT
jgi:hypothetical protein